MQPLSCGNSGPATGSRLHLQAPENTQRGCWQQLHACGRTSGCLAQNPSNCQTQLSKSRPLTASQLRQPNSSCREMGQPAC